MMRHLITMLLAAACVFALVAASTQAQAQQGNDKAAVSIRFRNETKLTVLVQGYTIVQRMQRRGQPLLIPASKAKFDNNVPVGVRFITIVDYNQPSRVLLRDFPIKVQPGRDLQVVIRQAPSNPNIVILTPD
jgi:hypothetical protein